MSAPNIEIAISIYLYHTDMWPEILSLLQKITTPYKIYIGLCIDTSNASLEIGIKEDLVNLNIPHHITHHANYGADTACFLDHLKIISEPYFIKIHSKKSILGQSKSINWFAVLVNDLIGSNNIVMNNLYRLKTNKKLGLLANKENIVNNSENTNTPYIKDILKILDIDYEQLKNKQFVAGTMFMSKSKIFQQLFTTEKINHIHTLLQQNRGKLSDSLKGTYAHALERIFGYIIHHQGYYIKHANNETIPISNKKLNTHHDLVLLYNNDCYIRNFIGTYGKVVNKYFDEEYKSYTVLWSDEKSTVKTYKISKANNSIQKFDPDCYSAKNADLNKMNRKQLYYHFYQHGIKENREYILNLPDNKSYLQTKHDFITYFKGKYDTKTNSSIILINHDPSLTGAPIFVHNLYNYLTTNTVYDPEKIFFMDAYPDTRFTNHKNHIYHFNDINFLKYIFKILNVQCIYSNSLNFYAANLSSFPEYIDKTFLHFHEDADYINKWMTAPHAQPVPILKKYRTGVVSQRIKDNLVSKYKNFNSNVDICPPFLSINKINDILNKSQDNLSDNPIANINLSKPIIYMCGSLCSRKNPKLFIDIAKHFPDYEFMWIGGNGSSSISDQLCNLYNVSSITLPHNFYWIPYTDNPYFYMNLGDYLFVTSDIDPCPTIILESLVLNKNVIILKNNVLTHYDCDSCYYINSNNTSDIINEIKRINITKKPKNNLGKNFVNKYYSKPNLKPLIDISNSAYII